MMPPPILSKGKSKKVAEAIRIYTLNVYLFPEKGNTYNSLARRICRGRGWG
jgi:hypothetical protein